MSRIHKNKDKDGHIKRKIVHNGEQKMSDGKQEAGFYETYIKRVLDLVLSGMALTVLSPLMLFLAVRVRYELGSPVIFRQKRPGKDEKIFEMYKFRSMTDARDRDGHLLPDEKRLTDFGKKLRASSLDELPELINILKGDMSIVGPRPQLVRDMVFMSKEQRRRHTVRPGLSGLAQVRGRNAVSWEEKLAADLTYIEKITFMEDAKIVLKTVIKVFKREGITEEGQATALDYGDWLLKKGGVTKEQYDLLQKRADVLMRNRQKRKVPGREPFHA